MKKRELNIDRLDTVSPLQDWIVGAQQSESPPAADTIVVDPGDPYPLAGATTSAGVTVNAAKPVGTIPQLANYLVSGFWAYVGEIAHHWGSNTISFNISGLNAAEQALALSALQAWHEVANVTFIQTTGSSNITFTHAGSMTAYTSANWNGSGLMTSATVDISSDWITNDGGAYDGKTGIDSYGYQTYIHEIGHALGLGHQGPYNGSATYSIDAIYANDTWQYSIMSYFAENNYSGSSYHYVVTPQMADIYAVASIYGAATATRSGDTVYGFNSTAGTIYDFTKYSQAPALTIYDSGGNNTLDCSGYSVAQTIDLHPGAFSSVGGLVHNIGISLNTNIQKAIAGSGNDTLIASDSGCTLVGGAGNDTMTGGAGNDTLVAGTGVDTMTGGGGADNFVFATGDSLAAHPDSITDFVSGDHIDLSAIDAISTTPAHDSFYFYGTAAFNHTAGELNYYYNSSLNVTVLEGDTNGDNTADFVIDLTGNLTLSLSSLIGAVAFSSVTIEAFGSTSLVQIVSNYYLNPASGGTGPEVMLNGSPLVAGQFSGWAPVGAEQISGGYELAMKSSSGQFIVWTLDGNGIYVTNTAAMAGTSTMLENYETSFQQDLNGDGVIGIPSAPSAGTSITIESFGATSLVQVGNDYFLNPVAGGAGPEVMVNGAPLVAGQFSGWAPVGAEQSSSGYELAMKSTAGQFVVWTLDSNGSYVTNTVAMAGTSTALENFETSFHQDLNGDGVIGIPAGASSTTIESSGVTSLVQVGNDYFLNPVAGGTGPEVTVNGSPLVVGQFSGWAPVGAEQTSSGYELAMYASGSNLFIIWTLDSNGKYVTNTVAMAGTSTALENFETSFHQDLNGDGVIGIPAGPSSTTIESSGVTSLVQVGNDYFLNPVAGGTGPEVVVNGSPLVVDQFSGWAPVGAEQTSSGYELAMKSTSGQFIIWTLDSNGKYVTNTAAMAETSTTLENFETSFHQDFNGDGVIGIPAAMTLASTTNNSFLFRSDPPAPPAAGNTGGLEFVHSTPLLGSGQGAASGVLAQNLVDLLGGVEHADAGHANFHFADVVDHFFIR